MTKNGFTNFINTWGPALLMMVIIFFASATPAKELPSFGAWDVVVKKGGHMLGYFLLSLAMLRGMRCNNCKTALVALVFVLLYASSDEFHQAFVAGRHSTPVDVGIDMIGATIGAGFWLAFARLRRFVLAGL
jgi:VanZ family protein